MAVSGNSCIFAVMKRNGFIYCLLCLSALWLMASCEDKRVVTALADISLMIDNERPDSALSLLDSIQGQDSQLGHHSRMLCRLYRLNAYNKLDTVFRSTGEAQELSEYFADHGSPNEQMQAYYLLGRAYQDIHEAPMALHYFQKASEVADTTAPDCNYRQLGRVYGQMSEIFCQQNLMEEDLRCTSLSIRYALLGSDTLCAVRSLVEKGNIYLVMGNSDSAIYVGEQASSIALTHGYRDISAAILGVVIRPLVEKGNITKARSYIERYEKESGYFDSEGNIENGREAYYYVKGLYYLSINQLDSAEYYFRKELRDGKDFNNQNAGSRGLALLYQKSHQPDSAAKYAFYSYAMNDSAYLVMATQEVEKSRAMYDYTRNQEIAKQEQDRANQEHKKLLWIGFLLFIVATISTYLIRKEKRERREVRDKYNDMVSTLAQTQSDLLMLRSHETELSQMIKEKEEKIDQLNEAIFSYQDKLGIQKESAENILLESPDYKELRVKGTRGIFLSESDWQHIYVMIINKLPNFYKFISSKKFELNDKEFKTSILVRLHVPPGDIAKMLNVTPAYITKIRNVMMKKLFGVDGKSKDLDIMLMDFS